MTDKKKTLLRIGVGVGIAAAAAVVVNRYHLVGNVQCELKIEKREKRLTACAFEKVAEQLEKLKQDAIEKGYLIEINDEEDEPADDLSNSEEIDLDGDGVADGLAIDTDGDGVADAVVLDVDNDGAPDAIVVLDEE